MNEPTVFVPTPDTLPDDVVHHGERGAVLPRPNSQPLWAADGPARRTRACVDSAPKRRPFVISRSGFAGLQRPRHALGRANNSSWWEHLAMSMPQLQNLGLSGYAWVGVDIGGFAGDATGEAVGTLGLSFGIFQPFCRNHSAWNTRPQGALGIWRTVRVAHSGHAGPAPAPAALSVHPVRGGASRRCADLAAVALRVSGRCGDLPRPTTSSWSAQALLVAPIAPAGHRVPPTSICRAGTWVHYWSGERNSGPGPTCWRTPPLGQPAIYVRANTPVPAVASDGVRRRGDRPIH